MCKLMNKRPPILCPALLSVLFLRITITCAMDMLSLYLFLITSLAHLIALNAQSTFPVSSRFSIVGTVYCDTCLNNAFSSYSYFIPGVEVHVECKLKVNSPKTTEMVTLSVNRSTDNNGVYKLEIPSVDGVDCIDGPPIQSMCRATLLGTSFTACDVPALKSTIRGISVKSKQANLCVYSFTPLSFRPRSRNDTLCEHGQKRIKV